MKPAQNHRVIKDKIINASINPSIVKEDFSVRYPQQNDQRSNNLLISQTPPTTSSSSIGSFNQGLGNNSNNYQVVTKKLAPISQREMLTNRNPSDPAKGNSLFSIGLPKITEGYSSALVQNERDLQQKRIKDLEKENYRLNHHIQQAERTLKNYRDVYGSIPSDPVQTPPRKTPLMTNKENLSEPETNQQQQQALLATEKQLRELQQRNQELQKENQRLATDVKALQHVQQEQSDQMKLQQKQSQQQHEKDEKLIVSLQQQISQLKEEMIQIKLKQSSPSPNKQTRNSPILINILSSAQLIQKEHSHLKSFAQEEITRVCSEMNEQLESLQNYFSSILHNTLKQLQEQKSEHIVYKVEKDRLVQELREKIDFLEQKQLLQSIKSPLKNTQKTEIALSPIAFPLSSPEKSSEKEVAINKQQLQQLSREYEQKINQMTQAVASLSDLHQAEIKSIKHLAHIRELIRVAKEREQAIDKDRMIIEIKQLKEIQNVLSFALKTAEQSLAESQPHVVQKLVEGRTKRIKLIEQTYKGKLKDIEQRSLETCAVSTSHLEVFQTKALENQQNTENMTKHATDSLLKMLQNPLNVDGK